MLYSAVGQSTEGIAISDLDGTLLFVNKSFAAMHGYSPDELAGKHLSIFHTPKQLPVIEEALAQIKDRGKFSGEVLHVRRDGTVFPTLMNNSILRNERGKAIGMIGTLRDISARKKALEALRESEERFKQVAENAGEWIWEVDPEGLYTYASPAVEQILGYAPEEIIEEKHFFDLFHPEERERLKSESFGVFAGKNPFRSFINRNIHKDGDEIWLLTSGVPFFDDKGKFTGYRGVDIDITELKRVEEALRDSEGVARALLDAPYVAVLLLDKEGFILDVNRTTEERLNKTREELIGVCAWDLTWPEVREHRMAHFAQVIKTGKPVRFEDYRKGMWNDNVYYPIFDAEGKATKAAIIARDITDLKRAEDELRRYQSDLAEMVKVRTAELIQVNKELKESEERLREQKDALEEKNVALREILEQLGVEKKKFKDDVVTNIENLVLPILHKLENEEGRFKREYLDLIKRNLKELATSFGSKLSEPRLKLSPREIEVCDMIKMGMSSKEIAKLLRISPRTVERHRDNIRRKFGIIKSQINLSSFLQSL